MKRLMVMSHDMRSFCANITQNVSDIKHLNVIVVVAVRGKAEMRCKFFKHYWPAHVKWSLWVKHENITTKIFLPKAVF
jgi:hypothetical protein